MLLHESLTQIQSQIKPWLLFGESFTLTVTKILKQSNIFDNLPTAYQTVEHVYLSNFLSKI